MDIGGRSQYFWFLGGVLERGGGYILKISSFSVHFLILRCKIPTVQKKFCHWHPHLQYSDLRQMQGFKKILTLTVNLIFFQGAVSFHPSVGTQKQPNSWNWFLFIHLVGLDPFFKQTTQWTTRRRVLRRRVLPHSLFIKFFIKKRYFLCKHVLSSSVHRYRFIRKIDIDNLKVHITFCLYLYLYMHPVKFNLSFIDISDPTSAWSSTSTKRFLANNGIEI